MSEQTVSQIEPSIKIRPDQSVGVVDLKEIWRYRILLGQMVRRQFIVRIASSPTSLVWSFVRPGVMTLAFHYLRRMSSANFGQDIPYTLYIFSGFSLWFLFQEIASQIASSLSSDAGVIQRVYYPRILGPLAILISRLFDFAVVIAAIVIFQIFLGVSAGTEFFMIIPITALYFALAFGLGAIFAALMLYQPDTKRILEIILYLGLFLSPVVFSKSILPPAVQTWYGLNPMVGVLTGARGALFAPSSIDYGSLAISACIAVIIVSVGLWLLSRAARMVAERL